MEAFTAQRATFLWNQPEAEEGQEITFQGYDLTPHLQSCNGWAYPSFTREVVDHIVAVTVALHRKNGDDRYSLTYDPQQDAFMEFDPLNLDEEPYPIGNRITTPEVGTVDGNNNIPLYTIGGGGIWTWMLAEPALTH